MLKNEGRWEAFTNVLSKMKRICLTGCNNIVGHGLEPLRESVVLEHICIPLPLRMSTVVVTPILDSILETEGNALREIEISNIDGAQLDLPLREFLAKFKNYQFQDENCESCGVNWPKEIQPASMTCFECFRYTCNHFNNFIHDHPLRTCENCGLTFCRDHGTECHGCETFYCSSCIQEDDVDSALSCGLCSGRYAICFECSIRNSFRTGCENCDGLHFPALVEKYDEVMEKNQELTGEIQELTEKNQEVTEKNEELTEENKQLRMEIEVLRKKMSPGLGILA